MSLIDIILNLAGLLLWFNWRSMRFDPLVSRRPATLIGTLRPAAGSVARRWTVFLSLPALLVGRGFLYLWIGAPADWVPKLNLGTVVLAFRVDRIDLALLFSLVSFLRMLAVAYIWLAFLSLVTRRVSEPDPILKLARLQLGRLSQAPAIAQALVPIVAIVLGWGLLHPLLSRADVVGHWRWVGQVAGQGLLVAAGLALTLKYLLAFGLLLYMVASYVYLGSNPVWDFVFNLGRSVLVSLRLSRLRTSRLDFAPLAGIVIVLVVLHTLPMLAMGFAASQGVAVWPD